MFKYCSTLVLDLTNKLCTAVEQKVEQKRKNLLTLVGIEPTTSGLDLLSLCRLSYKVAQRKSGTIFDGELWRRESKGTYECCATQH